MISAVADTHAAIWYVFGDARLSPAARAAMDGAAAAGDQIAISSITLAEIVYLMERSRIAANTLDELLSRLDRPNALLLEIPFDRQIAVALRRIDRAQVPELPDRMIAATAQHLGVPVISRDRSIQGSGLTTIW